MIRVTTSNLTHGIGFSPQSDSIQANNLVATAQQIDADIWGIQELDHDHPRSDHVDQLTLLQKTGGFSHGKYAATLVGDPGPGRRWETVTTTDMDSAWPSHAYGIGMVSRPPVVHWRRLNLAGSRLSLPMPVSFQGRTRVLPIPDEPRVALACDVECDWGLTTFVTAHLSFIPPTAMRQLAAIRTWLSDCPTWVVLGDLNTSSRVVRRTLEVSEIHTVQTYPAMRPRTQLDYIVSSANLHVTDVETHFLPAGDHLALSANVSLAK
jgi:endonuclease/exonuclease/phosphatase family metal-dependent hydrolase